MRFHFVAVALSGFLASCGGSQPQTKGSQIGQSTAPLPDDPTKPVHKDEGPYNMTAPISPRPAAPGSSGDLWSPVSPGPAPVPTAPSPSTTPDAGVWSPQPDAP